MHRKRLLRAVASITENRLRSRVLSPRCGFRCFSRCAAFRPLFPSFLSSVRLSVRLTTVPCARDVCFSLAACLVSSSPAAPLAVLRPPSLCATGLECAETAETRRSGTHARPIRSLPHACTALCRSSIAVARCLVAAHRSAIRKARIDFTHRAIVHSHSQTTEYAHCAHAIRSFVFVVPSDLHSH